MNDVGFGSSAVVANISIIGFETIGKIQIMKMFRVFLSLCSGVAFVLLNGCRDEPAPTKPPEVLAPDTSSHEFEWQMEMLGDGNASVLNDVAIINDTLAYAVGRISVKDSLGIWKNPPYNIARWNGQKWLLNSLEFVFDYGQAYSTAWAVFAFSFNDVVVSSGSSIMHWDGTKWRNIGILYSGDNTVGNVMHFWGTSHTNLWGGGLGGSLVYYNGGNWQKLESGTHQDIQDIWGARDPFTGEDIILAVAANIFTSYEKEVLQIKGTHVEKISTQGIIWPVDAIWFDPGRVYYTAGAGIYSRKTLAAGESWGGPGLSVTTFVSRALRGNHVNDIFVAGAFGDVLHYNGKSWRSYRETTALAQGSYLSVAVKENLVFAVGENLARAVVVRGKRIAKRN